MYEQLLEIDDEGHEAFIRYGQIGVALKREQWIAASALAAAAARLEQSARSRACSLTSPTARSRSTATRRRRRSAPRLLASQSGVFALPQSGPGPAGGAARKRSSGSLADARFEHRRIHIEEGTPVEEAPADVSAAERGATAEWRKCPSCGAYVYHKRLKRQLGVCPECNHHFRIRLRERLEQLLDPGSFEELGAELEPLDALGVRRLQALPGRGSPRPRRAAGEVGRALRPRRRSASSRWCSPGSTSASSAAAGLGARARRSRWPPSSRSPSACRCW